MREELEQRIAAFFSTRPESIAAVYLFDSGARGTTGQDRDIDIGVLFSARPGTMFGVQRYGLEGDVQRALAQSVDVIALNTASVDLRSRVLRDGRLLVERDRAARIAFEVRTRNDACDLAPILARCRAPRRGDS